MQRPMPKLLPFALSLLLCACSSLGVGGGRSLVLETQSGASLTIARAAERLSSADAVFLGEEHDSDTGHAMQLRMLRELHELRPDLVIAFEQFESDVQPLLDAYVAGEISEQEFLDGSRPWPNYRQHYRPIVEWAKARGIPLVAANIPRKLATRTSRGGFYGVAGEEESPWSLWTDEPLYRERFEAAMGGHGAFQEAMLERWYASQCLKDEKMAESMARAMQRPGSERPLVVLLCGKFHSDLRLGAVSRLARRMPGLELAVVTMSSGEPLDRPLDEEERRAADYVFRVPTPAARHGRGGR